MSLFPDNMFQETCEELENPILKDYEIFTDSLGVKIYRRYIQESGLYEYKIYGSLDVLPETCAAVYMDIEYRKHWDTYVEELKPINDGSKKGLYWKIKFPWPLSDRDYTFVRELKKVENSNKTYWVVIAKAEAFENYPEKEGVVRVKEYDQQAVLTSDGYNRTKAFMKYYDNPGGSLPSWLINWAAKKGVPEFLTIMQKSCRKYQAYLETKNNK